MIMPVATPTAVPLLALRGAEKSFPGTRALGGVDLALRGGEVHALVGQNGSGKSTLIKILSGYVRPDKGTLEIRGEPISLPIAADVAESMGLRFVHQNPGLSPKFTVLETVRLRTFETTWYGRVRWDRERAAVRKLMAELEVDLDPDQTIAELTPSQRALVAIVRAMQGLGERPGILVLDEPTASLTKSDAERLFRAVDRLRNRGHAILFVSHRLDEVLAIAGRITVLRDGLVVRSVHPDETNEADLIAAILGRELGALYPTREGAAGGEILALDGLSGPTVRDFCCTIRRGEIVGVTGLGGMGHDEVPYLAFGAMSSTTSGRVSVGGTVIEHLSPRRAIDAGMALLPADRGRAGGVGRATVAENITIGRLRGFFVTGWLRRRRELAEVTRLLDLFEVRPRDPDRYLMTLSGGNQQKALLAKWLHEPPRVLLLHEPTQGVDVGSRQQVFRLIRRAADAGSVVLIASSEYADLANVCDRVLVMRRGRIAGQLAGEGLSEDALVGACYATA
jgi:ribose transport system ATP-binding protein